jgi:ABC-2 type transport system ATP-binding protein
MVAQGVTAIVSTAYMDEAERFDRVAVLHRGRLLACDAPATLQQGLAGRVLSLDVTPVRDAQRIAQKHPGVRAAAVFGERVHVIFAATAAAGASAELAAALRGAGLEVRAAEPIGASMEDVFIDHVTQQEAP